MTTHALQMLLPQPNKETHCRYSQHNQTNKRTANKILYLVVLWVFAVRFFVCVVSICRTCCQTDEDVFLICMCFLKLQCVELSRPPYILEVFTEDPRPEDPGSVRVRVYILNGHPGPGRVPIYYFGSRVFLTLCVIPESIGEHRTRQRSASVRLRMRVFCNLQFVKLGCEKCEREIRWKKKKHTPYLSRQKQSAGGVNVVACKRTVIMSDVKKNLKQNWRDAPIIEHARSKV